MFAGFSLTPLLRLHAHDGDNQTFLTNLSQYGSSYEISVMAVQGNEATNGLILDEAKILKLGFTF